MIQLIYASNATSEMTKENLLSLLVQSRERNLKQNVTGLLLYADKKFLQVLEGEQKDVEEIYQSILHDDRNTSNVIYSKSKIIEREFPNWSMGFRNLDLEEKKDIQGFSNFLEIGEKLIDFKLSHAILLLNQFKDLTQ